jgi:HK97 family phage prohead protease
MSVIETRAAPLTPSADDPRTITARALRYDVVDSYGTIFTPGCATAALERRLPVMCWAHDWAEPIGRCIGWTDTAEALTLTCRLDDPNAVPLVSRAIAQIQSGTLTDVSIGFRELASDGNRFTEIEILELSLVIAGAVPGAQITDLRDTMTAAEIRAHAWSPLTLTRR